MTDAEMDQIAAQLVPVLAEHATRHDREGSFVHESYAALQEHRVFSLLVPTELGGGGASMRQVCELIRALAHGCGSTALALSMHTHLVAASRWKYEHGKPAEKLLRKVADEQAVLVSTGATDWVDSVGEMTKVEGGYRLRGHKVFGSGSPEAALMITSARYDDPELGPRVLHFPVPLSAEGVRPLDDWDTMGMRGTGSQTLALEDVFVPDAAIALSRPRGEWHMAWSVAITVAPPIYMAPYVGLAEHAAELARRAAASKADAPQVASRIGVMQTSLAAAKLAWNAMVDNTANLDFTPTVERADEQLVYKTLCTNAVQAAVREAITAAGGRGFFRSSALERCFRDVQASHFHPLPEDRQHEFTGRLALGRDPITGAAR